ncbi:MAG: toll/interleukin-1 receptor domain-containing protein [Bryobacteraceae bacterium]|nr:toll/interleukin-1 receptor domain-containing protein [Bryobacteraceae bacterium]
MKVFLSYSHLDEDLKKKLDAHLSALKRSGAIETWNDRKIGSGEEWRKRIDEQLISANIVLLLISSDFLASDFCYEIETISALERHNRGQAIVIPVVLRDVDFHGLPIASLQMLPKDAVAVTSSKWSSEDEALRQVAEGVRRAVARFRDVRAQLREDIARTGALYEPRFLDAAIASELPIGVGREVVALVRLKDSTGLVSVLPESRNPDSPFTSIASEVRSEPFEAKYTINALSEPESPVYRLTLEARDLSIEKVEKHFPLERGRDSVRMTFFVKADHAGEHHLRVNLFRGNFNAAEVSLRTRSGGDILPGKGGMAETFVTSVKLTFNVVRKALARGAGA